MIIATRGYGPGASIAFVTLRGYTPAIPLQTITDTTKINKPVDYFMGGDEDKFRKGFAPWASLKAIFRE